MAKRVAVIDIGSNSLRMVIYEKTSRFAFHILYEAKSRVRISQNAYQNGGNLQEIPMQRAFDALSNFIPIIASFKARKTLCVATSALRDAPNKKEFLNRVKNCLGLNIKVIDGQREAYLGAIACANLLPEQQSALSIDIGGGSTEFALISKKNILKSVSLNLGTVRLKELFFDFNNIDGAKEYIDKELALLDEMDASTIIGIGGTFRAISSAILTNSNYPMDKLHAYKPSYDDFEEFLEKILSSDDENLKKLGIKSSRFDVIKSGALILLRVFKKFNIKELLTSGVGVREGVFLADLLRTSNDRFPLNYNTSVRYILDAYIENISYANQISRVSKELFDLVADRLNMDKKYRHELSIASKLCMSGNSIHFYSSNKHSYELIQDALEFGFTHEQIALIATLARFSKRKLPSASHVDKFSSLLPHNEQLNALSYILSLSVALLSHMPRNIDFKLTLRDDTIEVESKNSLYLARECVEKLEPLKNSPLMVKFL
ncbi:Ppx/GppA phosphatase [Sulfurimonas denitrificans DSM 1251]|uniref:Ppx/GppA phosphatase n=1 Tax=Sulfurimonas denitrificans (strain ATCC 33889 / DSM 1251) TaxID=326298 RepID=Q30SU1_SULDN|nr:Ppx/GppA phosphatase family protein [Sulfurimonas denitrificans]ABB43940.1 Ppx/GppA phosphatase [Sulfurimonas denitrificans DSM 1251]MDD3443226.1 Ppx/GppA phosphatase family protein [Sulfurimonas denitrificans]